MKIITVNQNDDGQRVDKFLSKFLPTMPQSLLYKELRKKRVKRNKKALGPKDILSSGDELYLYINDEFFTEKAAPKGNASALSVLYEDAQVLIVDKPAGTSSHGGEHSLLEQAKAYLFEKGEYDPKQEQSFTPALSNRLDRNTRGLLLIGKTAASQKALNERIKNGEIVKEYLCLAGGVLKEKSGRLEHFLKSSEQENRVKICTEKTPGAKRAILEYRVLKAFEKETLLHIKLITGRKHQIRVQLAAIGHPLIGDTKYGAKKDKRFSYQALLSYRLHFNFNDDGGPLESVAQKTFEIKNAKEYLLKK